MSGPLLDLIGRRGSLRFSAIPLSTGWILIGFAKTIPCLLIGRLILGFAVGLMAVPAQVQKANYSVNYANKKFLIHFCIILS